MEREQQNENEKAKKAKKEGEVENDEEEDFEGEEGMESFGEASQFEAPTVASCPSCSPRTASATDSGTEVVTTSTEETISSKTKLERAILMKWMTVTGKQPLSIPQTLTYESRAREGTRQVLFGDRRPLLVEQQRAEHWMKLRMKKELAGSYVNEGRILREIRLHDTLYGLRCLRFSPHGDSIVTSYGNGSVQIRKADTGEVSLTLQTVENLYRLEVSALRYHPRMSARVYVGGAAGTIQVFDASNPRAIASIREKHNEICNLDLSPDGSVLVSVGKDGNVYLYDTHRLRMVSLQRRPSVDDYLTPERENAYHSMRVYGLKYHPTEPNIYVTGGWDYTVKVWDTRVCGAVTSIRGPRICGDSIDVRGREILTGSWSASNSLALWDLSSGAVLKRISVTNRSSPMDGQFVYVARFFTGTAGSNAIVVGGNGTDDVEVIDIDNSMAMATFPAMKAVIALDTHGDLVAYGGMESILRIGDMHTPRAK